MVTAARLGGADVKSSAPGGTCFPVLVRLHLTQSVLWFPWPQAISGVWVSFFLILAHAFRGRETMANLPRQPREGSLLRKLWRQEALIPSASALILLTGRLGKRLDTCSFTVPPHCSGFGAILVIVTNVILEGLGSQDLFSVNLILSAPAWPNVSVSCPPGSLVGGVCYGSDIREFREQFKP